MPKGLRPLAPTLALLLSCGLSEHPVGGGQPGQGPTAGSSGGGTGGSVSPGSGGSGAAGGTGGTAGNGGSTGGSAGNGGATGGSRGGSGGATGSGGSGQAGRDAGSGTRDQGSSGGSGPDAAATPDAPSMQPSGMQVSINGMLVPKEKVLVFLHIGHSNMAGRTTVPQALRPLSFETHPQLWKYGKGGVWTQAKEPLSPDSMTGSCGGVGCDGLPAGAGPGMSILRAALAAAPDSHIVSIGRGQSGLTGGYCRSFRKGGLLYDFVMGPAMELKGKVTFAGIWTMFGISEINDRANTSRVGDCLVGVANDMRGDLGEPDLPLLVGDWEEEARGGANVAYDSPLAMEIVPQFKLLPMRIPRCLVIPTDGLPTNPRDGYHYDLTGHKQWGERGIDLLKRNGWAPWARP